jgi:hypothetical protein
MHYPIYLFAAYRLAAVCVGCAIAFIWTIFPFPTTAGSKMRKSLGRALFTLANYYSCTSTSIRVWIHQEQGDVNDKSSPGYRLDRARRVLFSEEMALLSSLKANSEFTAYELALGGRFPRKTYDSIRSGMQTILTSMDLMVHSTRDLQRTSVNGRSVSTYSMFSGEAHDDVSEKHDDEDDDDYRDSVDEGSRSGTPSRRHGRWIRNLARAAREPGFDPHIVTSVLYHLSAAISNSFPLPPYLAPPHPFPLARNLKRINEDLLNMRNIEDPSFSAFVAVEVLSSMVSSTLKGLLQ